MGNKERLISQNWEENTPRCDADLDEVPAFLDLN